VNALMTRAWATLTCCLAACTAPERTVIIPPPAPASAPNMAELGNARAPSFVIGEAWQFSFESKLEPAQNTTFTQTVARVDDARTELEVTGGRPGPLILDATSRIMRLGSAFFEPSDQRLSFPLFVGKSWTASYEYRNGAWQSHCKREAKVVRTDTIRTPAGVFDAFRIEEKTLWQSDDLYGGQGVTRETLWYAPAAKRIVVAELVDQPLKDVGSSTRIELLNYTLPEQ
jgi:hypothetical protein